MVFPVVMYECESWTIKKAECRRIDAFELWCWRRLLRVPWTARRSNQSILKEISPEYSLEGWMLKLKLNTLATWCEVLTQLKRPWCWERLKAGGEGDDRGGDGWMASPTQWTWVWVNSGSWWWTGRPGVLQSMGLQRVGHNWTTELSWTKLMKWSYGCRMTNNMKDVGEKLSSVQSLSRVQLFATPWTAAHQASLSFTISQSLLQLMSVDESKVPSNHLILCHLLLLLPSIIFPTSRAFCSESAVCIMRSKYWSFSFSISPFNEYSGLISFRID